MKVLMPSGLDTLLGALPKIAGDKLDEIDDDEIRKYIVVALNSMQVLTRTLFNDLTDEQQEELLALCGTWVTLGLVIGWAPDRLREILSKSKCVEVSEPTLRALLEGDMYEEDFNER